MFFCQVLRTKPEGEKDTICSQLCLWLNSLCSCYSPLKVQNSSVYIGRNVTHRSTCRGGQILQNTIIVCKIKPRLFHLRDLYISPIAWIIQVTASILLLEFGLQHKLFPTSTCLSPKAFFFFFLFWMLLLSKTCIWKLLNMKLSLVHREKQIHQVSNERVLKCKTET